MNDERARRERGSSTRKLRVDWIEAILRAVLALPTGGRAPDDKLPSPIPLPAVVHIDASGWLAWALGGLRVFSLPTEPEAAEGIDTSEGTEGTYPGEETDGVAAHLATALLSLAALAGAGADAGQDDQGEPEQPEKGKPRARPWVPSIHLAVAEARYAVMRLAMVRHRGNITHIAASFSTSRRALREQLKQAGLYTPPRQPAKARRQHDDEGVAPPKTAKGGASP